MAASEEKKCHHNFQIGFNITVKYVTSLDTVFSEFRFFIQKKFSPLKPLDGIIGVVQLASQLDVLSHIGSHNLWQFGQCRSIFCVEFQMDFVSSVFGNTSILSNIFSTSILNLQSGSVAVWKVIAGEMVLILIPLFF